MKSGKYAAKLLAVSLTMALTAAACGSEAATDDAAVAADSAATETESDEGTTEETASADETDTEEADGDAAAGDSGDGEADSGSVSLTGTLAESDFYGEYAIVDDEHGTDVQVTLSDDSRIMTTNALPPWDAGEFPVGNNTEMSEQDLEYVMTLNPTYTGDANRVRVAGVSVAGIKFDAGTAQRAVCENGVEYNVEAVQSLIPFGVDEYGAHVQNDGTYHYHDLPVAEIDGEDPEFIGFAFDGHMIYYSPSGEYASSYQLRTEDREGTNCTYSEPDLEEITFDATPDGTFQQDWEFIEGSGDLDACNGVEIDGEYAYFITDEYPIIPRCLNGDYQEGGGGGGAGGGGEGGGPPAEGGGPPAPGGEGEQPPGDGGPPAADEEEPPADDE